MSTVVHPARYLPILGLLASSLNTPGIHAAAGSHGAIVILSDGDFASCSCVTSGSGTPTDPYVIGPWSINNVTGDAVSIDGSTLTKSFTLSNLTIAGTGSSNTFAGIRLNHINPTGSQSITAEVLGAQTSIQNNNIGIVVENSNFVILDGGGANPNGPGVGTSAAGTINQNVAGAIDVEKSSHVTVKGWQMSANGFDGSPDWVAFDPAVPNWAVGGVRFFGVSESTIDHNAANNDTSISYTLFVSSHNIVSNNAGDYPFTMNILLTDGSSNNSVAGNNLGTGDFIGLMVADPVPGTSTLAMYGASHDNILSGNQTHADGPTGAEKKAGVVPAFSGGLVVLNGTYNNTIRNNALGTGGGLTWAQAVPSSSSAIGVAAFPPLIHCNVTASEGGGGTANLNGNVWLGNSSLKGIDSCIPAQ